MVVGSSRAAAQEIWLGSAQVTMYPGRYPGRRGAVPGALLAGGRGHVGDQPVEKRREETLDWDGGGCTPKVSWVWPSLGEWETGTSGHLDIFGCGTDTWDRHTWDIGDLSAGPVPRLRNQWASRGPSSKNPGSVLPFPGGAWS